MKDNFNNIIKNITPSIVSILCAFLFGSIIILLIGKNPISVYGYMIEGAFGGIDALAETLQKSTPYIFGGLAFLVAAKSGLFNIGIEGQMYVGAITAAILGFTLDLSPALHIIVCVVGASIAGMIWSLLPAILKVTRGVHEVISTVMLNYIALAFTGYLTVNIFLDPGMVAQTPKINPSALFPQFLIPSKLNLGFFIAIVCSILLYVYLYKTPWGFDLRVNGLNSDASPYAGINKNKVMILGMSLSGIFAGLIGAERVLGVHQRFIHSFSPGYGFTSIAVSLLGKNHPLGVILSAILFGALETGGAYVSLMADTPRELGLILQALIIVFVASAHYISTKVNLKSKKRVKVDG